MPFTVRKEIFAASAYGGVLKWNNQADSDTLAVIEYNSYKEGRTFSDCIIRRSDFKKSGVNRRNDLIKKHIKENFIALSVSRPIYSWFSLYVTPVKRCGSFFKKGEVVMVIRGMKVSLKAPIDGYYYCKSTGPDLYEHFSPGWSRLNIVWS